MQIILYQRFFTPEGSPSAVSFVPFPTSQKHTLTVGKNVYEAGYREVKVTVPPDSKIDLLKNLLAWESDKGPMKSTATEIYNFAQTRTSGFRLG